MEDSQNKDRNLTLRMIQRLDSGIEFQNKRSKFLLLTRDSIIKKHNRSVSDQEAYTIAEFGLYVCEKYNLNPITLFAIGRQESRFNTRAKSHKGAQGLYQVMPLTARIICDALDMEYRDGMLYDPKINTELAVKYLDYLRAEYNDLELMLIGYNAGPSWANRRRISRKTELPEETVQYITAVKNYYADFNKLLSFYLPGNVSYDG